MTVANCPSETPPEENHLFVQILEELNIETLTTIEQDALGILSRCVSVLSQNVLSFNQSCVRLGNA